MSVTQKTIQTVGINQAQTTGRRIDVTPPNDYTLEKLRISERIGVLETKIDSLVDSNKAALHILTGNGHPEEGVVFRLKSLETSKKAHDSRFAWSAGTAGLVVAGVLTDWLNRFIFHHK